MVVVVPVEVYKKYAQDVIDSLSGERGRAIDVASYLGGDANSYLLKVKINDSLNELSVNFQKRKAHVDLILVPDHFDQEAAELAAKSNIDPYFIYKIVTSAREIRGKKIWDQPGLGYKPDEKLALLGAASLVKTSRLRSPDYRKKMDEFKSRKTNLESASSNKPEDRNPLFVPDALNPNRSENEIDDDSDEDWRYHDDDDDDDWPDIDPFDTSY